MLAFGLLHLSIIARFAIGKALHKVNNIDLNGRTCNPLEYQRLCPVMCVKSLNDCPKDAQPDPCPAGEYYCGDGKCHGGVSSSFACANVFSECTCSDIASEFLPCKQSVYLKSQNPDRFDSTIPMQCRKRLNVTGDSFLQDCAVVLNSKSFSFRNAECISFFILASIEGSLLFLFLRYKESERTKWIKSSMDELSTKYVLPYGQIAVLENGEPSKFIRFKAYREDRYGTIVRFSIIISTICWICFMAVLIGDYYELFQSYAGKYDKMLFENHGNLSAVFIVFWTMLLVWFGGLYSKANSLKTLFMRVTNIYSASHILVEKRNQRVVDGSNMEYFVKYFLSLESFFSSFTKSNYYSEMKEIKKSKNGTIYIEFECVRYIYDAKEAVFAPYKFELGKTNNEILGHENGLSGEEAVSRLELSGPNEILFKMPTMIERIKDEFSGIFYLYQFMMLIIWYFYGYYYMGLFVTVIIVGSGIVKVFVAEAAQKKVIQMATFVGYNKVLRNGQWTELPCQDLVVGDIIEIFSSNEPLSVDCCIISGDVVMDESSLTGESLPVSKFQLKNEDKPFSKEINAKTNILFAGTTVMQTQPVSSGGICQAIVLDIGGSTEKGKLVKDILFPEPFSFIFQEHLKVVVPFLILWGVVLLFVSMIMLGVHNVDSWFYGMFSISQVLSPVLPAVLVIGQSVSAERLRKQGIMCVDFNRITLAGKVKVFCFDKTGTLTKEGLAFGGVHEISDNKMNPLNTEFESFSYQFRLAMISCHGLSMAQQRVVGNFVDVEMFKATNANMDSRKTTLITPAYQSSQIEIVQRFEFSHTHAYMSVIVNDQATNESFVFLKGSYEKLMSMADPSSIPNDFEEVARECSSRGYYIIAIAGKRIDQYDTTIKREDYEKNTKLLGIMLFRNELKEDTAEALQKLRLGGCRTVMITGDNQNTAVFISKQAGLFYETLENSPRIIMAEYVQNMVQFQDVDTFEILSQTQVENMIYSSKLEPRKVELVVAGQAFHHLMAQNWLQYHLANVRVFARMKPMDKVQVVRMQMKHHVTAMCGDGGNDAGALKAAHAGIALSGSNSSVVSHFSSQNLSIECCVDLLKEARCSLDVSFAAYKLLIMYGEIIAFIGLTMYYFKVEISQGMWILVDGCTVPVSWALTLGRPAKILAKTRPTARLLGLETILSVFGQIVINVCFMCAAIFLLFQQEFFRCFESDERNVDLRKWWEMADNFEGEVIGFMLLFQILNAACAFNIGNVYRQGFWNNKFFIAVYATAVAILANILLSNPNPIGCLFRINCGTETALTNLGYDVWWKAPKVFYNPISHNVMSEAFRFSLFRIIILNLVAVLIWEGIIIQGPVRARAKQWANGRWQVRKATLNL